MTDNRPNGPLNKENIQEIEYALPVVWMLVRDAGKQSGSSKEQMRTEIGHGILNNETRSGVEGKGLWRIGLVVGLFETDEMARAFAGTWKSDDDDRATRGPLMRASRGMALADVMEKECWADFSVLSNARNKHWVTQIRDGFIYACPKSLVATKT